MRRFATLVLSTIFAAGVLRAAASLSTPLAPPPVLKERPVRLPPLLWYERDREEGTRLLMAAMLYWDVKDGDTAHRLLFPVFYHWREGDRSFLMSLPLVLSYRRPGDRWLLAGPFFRKVDEEKAQTLVFPLYWQRVRREGGRVTVAAPFVFYDYRSRDRQKIDSVYPVGFLRKRGDMNMGLMGPCFWKTSPEERFRVLFPIGWHGRSPELRFDVFVPFYHVWKKDPSLLPAAETSGHHRAGLFPLAGAGWGANRRSHFLFPIYAYSRNGDHRSLLTLPYSRFMTEDGRSGHLGLYFYNRDPDLKVTGVFPLWFRRRSTDGFESKTQVLNFWYSRENEDVFHTFFPLYGHWSNPEGSQTLSWGFWSRSTPEGTTGWAGLYFWKTEVSGDRNRIFFPLYWQFRRSDDWGVDVLFPFYTRYRDGDTTVTVVPPVIVRKSPDRRTVSLFLLYWNDRDGNRRVTTLAPLFFASANTDRKSFFSPLLWTRRSSLSREGIFPPVYWYRSAEARRTIVFPVYWNLRTASMDLWILPPAYRLRRDKITELGFFPLWGRRTERVETRKEGGDVVVSREPRGGYLFPFYWSDIDGKGNGTWVIPPILGFVGKSGAGTENEKFTMQYLLLGNVQKSTTTLSHGFFPLYQYVREEDRVNWWAPRGVALAAYERQGDKRTGLVFPWFWWRQPSGDRDLVLPLFYRSRSYEVSGSTETGRRRGERIGGATTFFPLWWSGRSRERSYLYIPPLYAQDREGKRNWRLVTPLWVSYDGATGRKFRVLFPLYWRYRSADPAPEKAGEERTAADPGPVRRDVRVFGLFYKIDTWKGETRSRTVGLAPLFSRTYTGPDDKYFEILGGFLGRDVQGGRRRFRILWLFYTPAR